jgi:hypothetical protein
LKINWLNFLLSFLFLSVSGHAVKLILPSLLEGLSDKAWRTKEGSIEILGSMAHLAPKQVAFSLSLFIFSVEKKKENFSLLLFLLVIFKFAHDCAEIDCRFDWLTHEGCQCRQECSESSQSEILISFFMAWGCDDTSYLFF